MADTLFWRFVEDFAKLNQQLQDMMIVHRRFSPTAHLSFFQDNVAASQTNVGLDPGLGAGFFAHLMPRAGHVIGFGVRVNDARTAGTLTATALVDGAALADTIALDGTNATVITSQRGVETVNSFNAGSYIGLRITTDGSWAPVTADLIGVMHIQFSMED